MEMEIISNSDEAHDCLGGGKKKGNGKMYGSWASYKLPVWKPPAGYLDSEPNSFPHKMGTIRLFLGAVECNGQTINPSSNSAKTLGKETTECPRISVPSSIKWNYNNIYSHRVAVRIKRGTICSVFSLYQVWDMQFFIPTTYKIKQL